MLHPDTYPLVVAYGFLNGSNFTFITPGTETTIEEVNEIILALLPECNGYRTRKEVAGIVTSKTHLRKDAIEEVIDVLFDCNILVEARQLYKVFHDLSANPMPFWWELDDEKLGAMFDRPSPLIHNFHEGASSFEKLLNMRVSTREFSSASLTHKEITRLCWATYGRIRESALELSGDSIGRGTVPSGGGLYPLKQFVIVMKGCTELPVGIYSANQVEMIWQSSFDPKSIWDIINGVPEEPLAASIILVLVCDFQQTTQKYSNRGYRYALLEAGHAAQNAYLWCTEQGLGIVEVGGFNDEKLAGILGLPYPEQAPLITLVVGKKKEGIK